MLVHMPIRRRTASPPVTTTLRGAPALFAFEAATLATREFPMPMSAKVNRPEIPKTVIQMPNLSSPKYGKVSLTVETFNMACAAVDTRLAAEAYAAIRLR
jgi:hypothetical protein